VASPGWTSPAELVAQVERLWDRGTLLRAAVQSDPLFPMALRLRGPTSRDHTKFIEVHRSLLGELLELTLPPESIKVEPGSSFDRRFGLREKPFLVRFRLLDPSQWIQGLSDLTVSHRGSRAP
jgi:hypothetical protein